MEALRLFFSVNKIRILYSFLIAAGLIAIAVMWIKYYGTVKYNNGYSDRNALCITERADDNEKRNEKTIEMQKDWAKTDARPSAKPAAILDRMRQGRL